MSFVVNVQLFNECNCLFSLTTRYNNSEILEVQRLSLPLHDLSCPTLSYMTGVKIFFPRAIQTAADGSWPGTTHEAVSGSY